MNINQNYAFNLLKKISFPRFTGAPQLDKAKDILYHELKRINLNPKLQKFQHLSYKEIKGELNVLSPYKKSYKVYPIGLSGNFPSQGKKGNLLFLDAITTVESFKNIKNNIPIFYNINKEIFALMKRYKIKYYVRVAPPSKDIMRFKYSEYFLKEFGKITGVSIAYEDALDLFNKNAKTVLIHSKQRIFKTDSYNILAEIKGTVIPDEKILICAHYDSVYNSPGVQDNAGGTVLCIELARFFQKNPPKRSLIFALFSAEEMGLIGSFYYSKQIKTQLNKIKLIINLDVCGPLFASNAVAITGNAEIENFVKALSKEIGMILKIRREAYSSDNIPFNEKNVASISIARGIGFYGHTPADALPLAHPEGLAITGNFVLKLVNRIANSSTFPFSLIIDKDDKEKVSKYLEERLLKKNKKG